MDDKKWLTIVAKQHKEWIKIVKTFGEHNYAEDIVQQMYEVLNKYASKEKIIKDGVVSRGYVFFTLRSIFLQYCNAKNKIQKVSLDDENVFLQIQDNSEMDAEIGYNNFVTLIDEHISNWRWYDRTLFKLYRDTDMSIRKISSETNISWVSIFHTLKKCKEELKDIFSEDFEDFKNKEYERISTKRQKN